LSDGSSPVLDYDVYYDQSTDTWILLESAILDTSYTTSNTLTSGLIYSFKITARNSVGDSLESDEIAILVAKIPDAPINLANVPEITTAYQIGLTWQEGPYDGSSPVIDYQVSYKVQGASDYAIYQSSIAGTSLTVTGLTPGVIYTFVVQARNIINFSEYSIAIDELAAQIPDEPTSLANVAANTESNQIGL
jgi:hypothetical protein